MNLKQISSKQLFTSLHDTLILAATRNAKRKQFIKPIFEASLKEFMEFYDYYSLLWHIIAFQTAYCDDKISTIIMLLVLMQAGSETP